MVAYWRAANYVSVGQIYLRDNPLLKRPLALADVKSMLLGHWGTTPGQNFIYVHLNRIIKNPATDGAVLPILTSTATRSRTRPSWRASRRARAAPPRIRLDANFVEGSEPEQMHEAMTATLDLVVADAPAHGNVTRPRWPMIVLKSPKGRTARRWSTGWMRSYRPSELFDDKGRLIARLPQILRSRLRAAAAPTLLR